MTEQSDDFLTIPEGWKDEYKEEDFKSHLLVESSFSTLFPQYREKYIQQTWNEIRDFLKTQTIKAELDLIKGSMLVKTTIKTRDPMSIINARDYIKVISRGVPFDAAKRIFKDDCACEVIKIDTLQGNQERFKKRRQRLVGKDGATLKALELLTDCYILIQGHTVSVLGPHRGLKDIRKVIVDTMKNNIHPVYNIKTLMLKKELAKNPALKNESWDRFLPKFKKTNTTTKKRKSKKRVEKKEYTPFPPPQPMSKMDKEMESGEYFLKEDERKRKKKMEQKTKQIESMKKNTEKRMKSLQAPKEKKIKKDKKSEESKIDAKTLINTIKQSKATKRLASKSKA